MSQGHLALSVVQPLLIVAVQVIVYFGVKLILGLAPQPDVRSLLNGVWQGAVGALSAQGGTVLLREHTIVGDPDASMALQPKASSHKGAI